MPRFIAGMGVLALSALIAGPAAADPVAPPSDMPQQTVAQSLDASIHDAQLKRTEKDYTGAVRVLSQLMLVTPDDPRVVGEYGKVLVEQGRAKEALDFLVRAVELKSNDWTLYSALGIAYDQTGDFANARIAYERALSLDPGEGAILNNYAMSRMLAGDLTRAKTLIAEAAARSKDDRIARNLKLIDGLAPVATAAAIERGPVPPARAAAENPPPATAEHAPRPLTHAPASAATVMMQAVPVDPEAGPVHKPVPHHKLAKAKPKPTPKAEPKAAAASGIPALRLANDRP